MRATKFSCLCFWSLLIPCTVSPQTKTFEVRGRAIQLEVDPNYLLVHPERVEQTWESVAEGGIRAQARLLSSDPSLYFEKIKTEPPDVLLPARGVLVPRFLQLDTTQVLSLAALSEDVGGAEMVFRYGDQRVVLTGSVSVRFRTEPPDDMLSQYQERFDLRLIERPLYADNVIRFAVSGAQGDPFYVSEILRQDERVQWAEADLTYELRQLGGQTSPSSSPEKIPDDVFFPKQWYLAPGTQRIQAPEAWAISTGTDRITVAVLDDGVDLTHPDLMDKLVAGHDFWDDDAEPKPQPTGSHGTACAGIIAAATNNALGVAGIAWDVKIMPVRIASNRFVADHRIADAIEFAGRNGAKVLNFSWGGGLPSEKIFDAIDKVTDDGALVVAAAGNAIPAADVFFPASYDRTIAVGAVNQDNLRWSYSCYGPGNEVELVAPSGNVGLKGDIWSTDNSGPNGYNKPGPDEDEPTGDYTGRFGGTSAATPIVAGVAALIWSSHPTLTAEQVRRILERTAKQVDTQFGGWQSGRSKYYGWGKVNALAAMREAQRVASAPSRQFESDPLSRLESVLEPKPESYLVREHTVQLNPSKNWVALVPREFNESPLSAFSSAVTSESLTNGSIVKVLDDVDGPFYIAPRSALLDRDSLARAAQMGTLPRIFPVYEAKGGFIAPLGTITLRVEGSVESSSAMLEQFAETHGLEVLSRQSDRVRLRIDDDSKFENVFDAARACSSLPWVRWCEPDFVWNLEKFITS